MQWHKYQSAGIKLMVVQLPLLILYYMLSEACMPHCSVRGYVCTAGAFLFEDVGVTAFHGAIPQVKNNSNLQLLAGIAPVEAYHAAILRTLLYQKGLEPVVPYDIKVFDFVQVSAFLLCPSKKKYLSSLPA